MAPSRRRWLPLLFTSSLACCVACCVVCCLAAACDKTETVLISGPEEVSFPAGFRWGASTSAFQTETGNLATDWGTWVQIPGKVKRGETPEKGGPNSLNHIAEDVQALKASGLNAYRFSIEWAKLYPNAKSLADDTPNQEALDSYTALVTELHNANIRPLVTLQHFSLPAYLSDPAKPSEPQGWERPETKDLFVRYCSLIAARFKDHVDDWLTINEPIVADLAGYVIGSFPPGVAGSAERAFAAARAQARAHAAAYEAIHIADTGDADGDGKPAWVSVAANQQAFEAKDPNVTADVEATKHIEYIWNLWFLNAIVKGDWDDDFDGKYDGPKDLRGDASLARHADFLGVNYYGVVVAGGGSDAIPGLGASLKVKHLATKRPKTDMAWDIHPEGLRRVLLQARDYELPIIVTENGIADGADRNRARYITEHLYQAGWAIQGGVDLRGYFYWSLLDNFEWGSGYCPKFGLHSVDPTTAARTSRPSAGTYQAIISAGKVRRDAANLLPPYASAADAGTICE